MLKPQRAKARRYWETLTDEQLLKTDLITDDPESLDGLVTEVPDGDEEPYVEFKYDLRGTGREEEFSCVHGHHRHLAGFVMRKDGKRFMVGWMCGKSIYGEDFDHYTADFDWAVSRKKALHRTYDIKNACDPFVAWLAAAVASDVFHQYNRVGRQIEQRLPWIYDNLPRAAFFGERELKVRFPQTLFGAGTDPEQEFKRNAAEFTNAAMQLSRAPEEAVEQLGRIRSHMRIIVDRIEAAIDQLKELEDFFQPQVLGAICDLANIYDHPKKRKYAASLMEVSCKRDKEKTTVAMPKNYRVPSKAPIETLRKALNVLDF
jgi:hypothetical protein